MAERDGTGGADGAVKKQVPMLTLLVWDTIVEENTCNTSPRLWKASIQEAAAPGEDHNVCPIVIVVHGVSAGMCKSPWDPRALQHCTLVVGIGNG